MHIDRTDGGGVRIGAPPTCVAHVEALKIGWR